MPDTYSQIYVHVVFAVKNRSCLIHSRWESELYKYITGIVQNNGQKMLAINGMPDHVHFLIGMKPSCRLSDLVREVKKSSTAFVRRKKFTSYAFQWQEGFGAFSHSRSHMDRTISYILSQKEHHKKVTFQTEYRELLEIFEIDYKEQYLFEFWE